MVFAMKIIPFLKFFWGAFSFKKRRNISFLSQLPANI